MRSIIKQIYNGDLDLCERGAACVSEFRATRDIAVCFLQALFGESCKIFLENIASPFWRKLQHLAGNVHFSQMSQQTFFNC